MLIVCTFFFAATCSIYFTKIFKKLFGCVPLIPYVINVKDAIDQE
jgi:hypothetical protein